LRVLRVAAHALAGLAVPAALLAQQTNPIASESEQRSEARARAESPSGKSDWEREQGARDFSESDVTLPAPPSGGLIEFPVSTGTSFRFFIDPASLSVGADGVVRYVLVARSPTGVDNVSYEGMRCGVPGMVRVYAFAQGGKWSRNANSEWREIEAKSIQRWHSALRSNYFCPTRYTIQSTAEGVDALRRGGHPAVANTGSGGGGSR
jgi:CNP1-like family